MLTLRLLDEADITDRYLAWFRDAEVTRFLEARDISRADAIEHLRRPGQYVYAIEWDGRHVGNVKIGPIDRHGVSDLVTVIGDRSAWGQGLGAQVVDMACRIGFEVYGVRKYSIGIYRDNVASLVAYTRAGFSIEAILEDHVTLDGKPQAKTLLARFAHEPTPAGA